MQAATDMQHATKLDILEARRHEGKWAHGIVRPEWFRLAVGCVALAFPFVLLIWGAFLDLEVLATLSDYYRHRTRDAFVGMLFIVALALIGYRGYDKGDHWATVAAGVLAGLIAVVPVSGSVLEVRVHNASASAFFLLLAIISLKLFTLSDKKKAMTAEKKMRNRLYKVCGGFILGCLALLAVLHWAELLPRVENINLVLWLESGMVWAFGLAWLIKAEVHPLLFADPPEPEFVATHR